MIKKLSFAMIGLFLATNINAATELTLTEPPSRLTVSKDNASDVIKVCSGQPLVVANITCEKLRDDFKDVGLFTQTPDGKAGLCNTISQVCCAGDCIPPSLD